MGDATANVEPEANNDSSGMETTHSNLRCFLDSVTPIVETHKVPKPPFLPLPNNYCGKVIDGVKCFYLGDLWNKFYEWSTCGVGTPVRLPSGETVVQYFVPYLSAIQLYTNNNNVPTPQSLGWHSDYNVIHGRRFDDYNKNGFINTMYPKGYEAPSHISKLGDKSPRSICKGELFFKYFELDSPYEREPFVDKVYELSCNCPSLASLSSLELSPSSWVSVFWYPMSHVPAKNLKDLNTCFLTYHSLSTSEEYVPLDSWNAFDHLALAPFGLATHKLDHKVWASPKSGDQEHISSLFGAAQSWLKKNNIYHNDFNYFLRNNFST
ncbi:hypothetical protein ACP70R_011266 [Stipagrostis hirtigluma subsp. patula]